jgi:hypothetical protein
MTETIKVCPFVGQANDPETLVSFPSEWNCCHHVRTPVTVNFSHQNNSCLSHKFIECPVFLRERANLPLPTKLRAHPNRKQSFSVISWFLRLMGRSGNTLAR